MTVAMLLGMAVLGMTFRAIHLAVFGTGFDAAWHEHTELAVFAMTFNMTLPMVALMRYRGHGWERCGEMAAAMFGLAFALLMPFWLGALSADAVLPLEMALMLPAMVAVMALRFDEYAGARGLIRLRRTCALSHRLLGRPTPPSTPSASCALPVLRERRGHRPRAAPRRRASRPRS